jgi:hypothetical protein
MGLPFFFVAVLCALALVALFFLQEPPVDGNEEIPCEA